MAGTVMLMKLADYVKDKAAYGIVIRCQIKLWMIKCTEGGLVTSRMDLKNKSIIKKAETACDRCI
jgi:hypothetical protein